jgi:hypothetical protein
MSDTPQTDAVFTRADGPMRSRIILDFTRSLERENAKLRALLLRVRQEPDLLRTPRAGGQDQYAGMPPIYRIIDSELKLPWPA